ncbi:MAG: D-2-hydroxyacid dehydrogenase [Treponema sp.]|jgi:phosphoglycerate dehydrogenase-like enzyme|nr:D-2-hydroxyacid dehydrogenase [Treponema sp.]
MKTVLVLIPVQEKHKKILESATPTVKLVYENPKTVSAVQVQTSEIIMGYPQPDLLKDSQKLEWLQLQSAGVGPYAKEGVLPKGVILTTAIGSYGVAIAENMLGVLLELYKNLHTYRDLQAEKKWFPLEKAKAIYNSTALIIGAGDAGGEFAKLLKAFGAYVIGIKRTLSSKPDYFDEIHEPDKLDILLPKADIVGMCLPGTEQTKKIINERTLNIMKPDAVLINAGRGSCIDEDALCSALEKGHLYGAALDVFSTEPLPMESRLWKIKNLILTPHIFGGLRISETLDRMVNLFAKNLAAYIEGKPLVSVYDPARGY